MPRPLLTIVIPSFNSGQYLPQAIHSITEQDISSSEYEVVIVDNLSTDNTQETLESMRRTNITIIREKDRGQSDALNKGFGAAKGDWLCWLNADDEFVPASLPKVLDRLATRGTSRWIGGGMVWIDVNSTIIRCSPHLKSTPFLRFMGIANVSGPSSFFRRSLFENCGRFSLDLKYCMDTDMWYRFQQHGAFCDSIPSYVWGFRVHPQSKTTSHVATRSEPSNFFKAEVQKMLRRRLSQRKFLRHRASRFAWRAAAITQGRDFNAMLDTLRYRGKHITCLAAP